MRNLSRNQHLNADQDGDNAKTTLQERFREVDSKTRRKIAADYKAHHNDDCSGNVDITVLPIGGERQEADRRQKQGERGTNRQFLVEVGKEDQSRNDDQAGTGADQAKEATGNNADSDVKQNNHKRYYNVFILQYPPRRNPWHFEGKAA